MSRHPRLRRVVWPVLLMRLGGLAPAQSSRIVTATRANGTYRQRASVIRILALGHNKLRVQLDLIYEYKTKYGLMANIGSALGDATIADDIAVFQPPDYPNCTVTIKFLAGNKIKVTQDRDSVECGFGHHVFADGTYAKVKGGKPKFEPDR
jgi:hypothetical protein